MSSERLQKVIDALIAVAPRAALVIGVLIVGLILSSVARRVVRWLARKSGLEALAEKIGVAKPLYAIGARNGVAELLGTIAWLAGILLTVSAVADLLQLKAVAAVTSLTVQFLPRLLAAAGVLLGGLAVAAFARNVVRAIGSERDDVDAPDFVAQLSYYVIVIVAVTLAADQAGLQTGIVESLILIGVGVGIGGIALAFALGARQTFHDLTTRHYYEKLLLPGDRVRVGDHAGVVLEFSPVALVLSTDRGQRIIVPCRMLSDGVVAVEHLVSGGESAPPPAPTNST